MKNNFLRHVDKTSLKQFSSIFFFSVFPILSLYLYNDKFVDLEEIIRPFILTVVMGFSVYILLTLILKNRDKAFLLSFLVGIQFFTYGHVYFFLKDFIRHRYLIIIWAVIFFIGCWVILKKISSAEKITEFIFVTSIILFLYPAIQVGLLEVNKIQKETGEAIVTGSRVLPDIYYITVDGYARADVIEKEFNFDNRPFISALEERGFLVADCSQSNYPWTHLSLTSSLNLDYLDSADDAYHDSLRDAAVWPMLKKAGYLTIVIDSGLSRVASIDSDVMLSVEESPLLGLSISDFEVMLMETSMGLLVIDSTTYFSINVQPAIDNVKHNRLYTKTIFTLEELKGIADEYDSPKFVYVHMLVPHDPYIFSPEGDYIPEETDMKIGYINSIKFLNPRILEFIDAIIKKSQTPPVIVLQSDHGWTWVSATNRLSILNAFYLPEGGEEVFYNSISPVNTLRSIFNYYWGTNFEILEDKSYFSPELDVPLDQFEFVPNTCVSQNP
jgi:hypothetical protein